MTRTVLKAINLTGIVISIGTELYIVHQELNGSSILRAMGVTFPIFEALYFSSHPEDDICVSSFLQSKRTPHSVVLYPVVDTQVLFLYYQNGFTRGLITVYDYLQFVLHTKDDNDSQERSPRHLFVLENISGSFSNYSYFQKLPTTFGKYPPLRHFRIF